MLKKVGLLNICGKTTFFSGFFEYPKQQKQKSLFRNKRSTNTVCSVSSPLWRTVWWGMTGWTTGRCWREKHGHCVSRGKPQVRWALWRVTVAEPTLPSAATAQLNMLTGDRTDVSSKCSDQYSLHPERRHCMQREGTGTKIKEGNLHTTKWDSVRGY